MNQVITQCSLNHIPQLIDLWREYLIDQGEDPIYQYMDVDNTDRYGNILNSFLKKEPEGFLVALEDDTVIGFVIAQKDAIGSNYSTRENIGNVQVIHTKRDHRRSGVASQLMEKALEYLKEMGCTVILSETDQQNTASLNLLLKHGFKKRGNLVNLIREE